MGTYRAPQDTHGHRHGHWWVPGLCKHLCTLNKCWQSSFREVLNEEATQFYPTPFTGNLEHPCDRVKGRRYSREWAYVGSGQMFIPVQEYTPSTLLLSHNYACWVGILWIPVPQSPDNMSLHLHITLSLKWGGDLYSNVWLVSTICPHKRVDAVKSYDDLAVAIQGNSSNIGHVPWESSQVCWYFLQKSGSEITCSHQWWEETEGDWVIHMCVYIFRGQQKHYSVHVYMRYSRRWSPQRTWG